MLFHGFYILSTEPLIVSYMASNQFYTGFVNELQRPGQANPDDALPAWFRPKYILEHIGGWSVPWHRMGRLKVKQVVYSLEGRAPLSKDFEDILSSDCWSAYNPQRAIAKQKCLVPIGRELEA